MHNRITTTLPNFISQQNIETNSTALALASLNSSLSIGVGVQKNLNHDEKSAASSLRGYFQHHFTASSYLITQLETALNTFIISQALENAEFNGNKKIGYFAFGQISKLDTVEGDLAVVINWHDKNYSFRNKSSLSITTLFISKNERVFISEHATDDYRVGMQVLYGTQSFRHHVSSAVIKAVADNQEVVELIGKSLSSNSDDKVSIKMKKDQFIVNHKNINCLIDTNHYFYQKYYELIPFMMPLWKTHVAYQKEESIPEKILTLLDENHCKPNKLKK